MKYTLIIIALALLSCKSKKPLLSDEGFIIVSDVGVKSNDKKEQTKKIQEIFLEYRSSGKFFFPSGTYIIETLQLYPGIHIVGEEGTKFVRKANCGKFSRMFNSIEFMYEGKIDSRPIVIRGLDIDGNAEQQGPYQKYQLEHQAMMFFAGSAKKKGRLKVRVEDCKFRNGVGDAISIWRNVDAEISNIKATDVFRGAVTITGGHTVVKARNIEAGGSVHPTGVDIEIDGKGYKDSYKVYVEFDNVSLAGDFDVGIRDGSTFVGTNIKCMGPPYNFYAPNSTIRMSESEFYTNDLQKCKVYYPGKVKFENCTFYIQQSDGVTDYGAMLVFMNTRYRSFENLKLTLENCHFIVDETLAGSNVNVIQVNADNQTSGNLLEIRNSSFDGPISKCVAFKQGGSLLVNNVIFDGQKGVVLNSVVNAKDYTYYASISNVSSRTTKTLVLEYKEDGKNRLKVDSSIKKVEAIKGKSKTKLIKK